MPALLVLVFPGAHLRRERYEGDTANKNKEHSHVFFLSGLVNVMGLLTAGAFVNANFTVDCPRSAQTARNRGQKSARLEAPAGLINCVL